MRVPLCRSRLLLCLLLVSTGIPGRTAGSDWAGFLGPGGDGKSPETGLRTDWPAAGPPVVWHKKVGQGYSTPTVSRGRLFFFDRHGDQARLTCSNSETGKEIWRSEYPTDYEDLYRFSNGPRAVPVVDGDRVYTFGVEGRLRCHRALDGELVWEVDTRSVFGVVQNFFGVGSTPVVEGPLLIVPVGGSPSDSPGIQSGEVRGAGSGIVAFDKRTGEVRYRVTDELAGYASPVVTTIGDRRWGLLFARGGLVGFEPASGEIDFEFPWRARKLESVNAANPVVVDDTVFITESYGPGAALLKVRPGGYDVIRKDPPGRRGSLRSHWATPIHHEGYLYGCSGSGSGDAELRAVSYESGKIAWSKAGLGRSTAILADDHLWVLTERGRLLVVRATPEAYHQVAETTVPHIEFPAWNPPVLSHGLLYVRGKDHLVCLDLNEPSKKKRPPRIRASAGE